MIGSASKNRLRHRCEGNGRVTSKPEVTCHCCLIPRPRLLNKARNAHEPHDNLWVAHHVQLIHNIRYNIKEMLKFGEKVSSLSDNGRQIDNLLVGGKNGPGKHEAKTLAGRGLDFSSTDWEYVAARIHTIRLLNCRPTARGGGCHWLC